MPDIVVYSRAGNGPQPSPAIWKDCPGEELNQTGDGYFIREDFLGLGDAAAADKSCIGEGKLHMRTTGTTVLTQKAGKCGGFLNVATGTSDNDAAVIFSGQFCKIVLDSGNKVWFEARLQGAVEDKGLFVGLIEEAGMTEDVVAANGTSLITESLIGFQVLSSATSTIDAVMKLDAGTVVKMQAAAGTLVASTEIRLGFKFDGKRSIEIYVNGALVSKYPIVSATFPVNVLMGIALAVKTGTAASSDLVLDFVQAAAMGRY